MNRPVAVPMFRGSRFRGLLVFVLGWLSGSVLTGSNLFAQESPRQEPVRIQTVDAAAVPAAPQGTWVPLDRTLLQNFVTAQTTSKGTPPPGGLDQCQYQLAVMPDGSLAGTVQGTFRLASGSALLSIGQPTFSLTDLQVDQEAGQWGTSPLGQSFVYVTKEGSELRARCSQQGARRGNSLEWSIDWMTAVASKVELTIPVGFKLEAVGALQVDRKEADKARGTSTLVYEVGARPKTTFRLVPEDPESGIEVGCDLTHSISALPTKILIQTDLVMIAQRTTHYVAEIPVPEDYTVLRISLPSGERLTIDRSANGEGPLKINLGELVAGQRTTVRIILERSADWLQPTSFPRIAPTNATILRSQWNLQVEKPLELVNCETSGFVQTSLAEEGIREVWSYLALSPNASLTATVRLPESVVTADCLSRIRPQAARMEVHTAIELTTNKASRYELELELAKPWKIVSASTPDTGSGLLSLGFEQIGESENQTRHRVFLRSAATPSRHSTLLLVVAAQMDAASVTRALPVIHPVASRVQQFALVQAGDVSDLVRNSTPATLADLRAGLKSDAIWRGEDLSRLEARKLPDRPGGVVSSPTVVTDRPSQPLVAASEAPVHSPLAQSSAMVNVVSYLGDVASDSHLHRVEFTFDRSVILAGEQIELGLGCQLISVEVEGTVHNLAQLGTTVTFPENVGPARQLSIRYRTHGGDSPFTHQDAIAWPQTASRVSRWVWRIETSPEFLVTKILAPVEFVTGMERLPVMQRWMFPLRRPDSEMLFLPYSRGAWSSLFEEGPEQEPSGHSYVEVTGSSYPVNVEVTTWDTGRLNWLAWTLFTGSLLLIFLIRRLIECSFRLPVTLLAMTSLASLLAPVPYDVLCGSAFAGLGLGLLIPRRLVRLSVPRPAQGSGTSSIGTVITAGMLLLAVGLLFPQRGVAQPGPGTAQALIVQKDGVPEPMALVTEALSREIQNWQREQAGPAFLLRDARYKVTTDTTETASLHMEFGIVIPRPEQTPNLLLPFEGVIFRSPESVTLNGQPAQLSPTSDGKGVVVTLPRGLTATQAAESGTEKTQLATVKLELKAAIRVSQSPDYRGFSVGLPQAAAAYAEMQMTPDVTQGLQSNVRGRLRTEDGLILCEMGTVPRWLVRWPTPEASPRPARDFVLTARAESLVTVDPDSLRFHTRLVFTSPDQPDPFRPGRVDVRLPANALVNSVTGEQVSYWRTIAVTDGQVVQIDLANPLMAGQRVDLQYILPVPATRTEGKTFVEIPSLALLAGSGLTAHQISLAPSSLFVMGLATLPDSDLGLWELNPAETSNDLRQALGVGTPALSVELQKPLPIGINLELRSPIRAAELEQKLTAVQQAIQWTGTARIETTQKGPFVHEFLLDPDIELTSMSVMDRDVEQLSRSIRSGERLTLVLRESRAGAQNIQLQGVLKLEAGKVRDVPLFQLVDGTVRRSEIVVTSTAEEILQVRRTNNQTQSGRPDSGWEQVNTSSQRFTLSSPDGPMELRWINSANPVRVTEFIELDGDDQVSLTWNLESTGILPSVLSLDAPQGCVINSSSGYKETFRHDHESGRSRIELQAGDDATRLARLELKFPVSVLEAGVVALPQLADQGVRSESWLAVPVSRINQVDVLGDCLDVIPASAPSHWRSQGPNNSLLVFAATGKDWQVSPDVSQLHLGSAHAETIARRNGKLTVGETRWILTPDRVGLLEVSAPENGEIHDLTCLGTSEVLPAQEGSGRRLLLRPSRPVSLIANWSAADMAAVNGEITEPVLQGIELKGHFQLQGNYPLDRQSLFLKPQLTEARLGVLRLTALMDTARLLPIGVQPPNWLQREIRETSTHPLLSELTEAVEARRYLENWESRNRTANGTATMPSTPWEQARQAIQSQAFMIAGLDASSDLIEAGKRRESPLTRSMLPNVLVACCGAMWLLILTRGAVWASRLKLADRIGNRPALMLGLLGLIWWLLLSPSLVGLAILLAAVLWGTVRQTPLLKARSTVQNFRSRTSV